MDTLRNNGVVGAGGAGFPTYMKLKSPIKTFIVNGAECEPLLHKDKELLKRFGQEIVVGMRMVSEWLGADEAILGIKGKYQDVIDQMQPMMTDGLSIFPLGDFYPSGDEFVLVQEVTGRTIPRGGLPLHVDCAVMNVETLLNIAQQKPVTHKYLTVAGAVHQPQTVCVPIGTPLRYVLEQCGGANIPSYQALLGGVMMGRLVEDFDAPVTKTTGGLLIFPEDHNLIKRYQRTEPEILRIGHSACDQCTFCTELCPRYLLGHPIEPHKAMRSLGFSHDKLGLVEGTMFCCECNLCSMIACPEDLDPKNVCSINKRELREQKFVYPEDAPERSVHWMREGRQTPLSRLMTKLGLNQFTNKGPLTDTFTDPHEVTILFSQHVGAPAEPVVQQGMSVRVGDLIATVPADQLGVSIHASIDGVVREINESAIIIAN